MICEADDEGIAMMLLRDDDDDDIRSAEFAPRRATKFVGIADIVESSVFGLTVVRV